jgi:hypothetical protein
MVKFFSQNLTLLNICFKSNYQNTFLKIDLKLSKLPQNAIYKNIFLLICSTTTNNK